MRRGNGEIKVHIKSKQADGIARAYVTQHNQLGGPEHKNMPQCCQHAAVAVASQSICL